MKIQKKCFQTGFIAHDPLSEDSDQSNPNGIPADGSPAGNFFFGKKFCVETMQPAFSPPFVFAASAASSPSTSSTPVATTKTTSGTTIKVETGSNWYLSLSNANLETAVKADVADGTITYAEMLSILDTVEAKGAVTASEFSDLQTIAVNLNNGIMTSSYVANITDKLVFGDMANAYWTGGSNTSVVLGNLGVGTSAVQMSELIGKWFLGSDLPSVCCSSATYVNQTASLYGPTGAPVASDINQGALGDCYLEASMAEIAIMEPAALESMFQNDGNGVYGVRFFINGVAEWVTVNSALPQYGSKLLYNSSTDLWAGLIEKAYAELNASGMLPRTAGNSFQLIQGGSADTITEITDKPVTCYYVPYALQNYAPYNIQGSLQQMMITALSQNNELWLASEQGASVNGKTTFVTGHAYSITGYDSSTGDFIFRNPWGTASNQYWLTTFEASLSQLGAADDYVAIASGTKIQAPTSGAIAGVFETPDYGDLNAGKTVTITLLMGSNVNVSGAPTLTLNDGGVATYVGGTGTNALEFSYTVLAGQNTYELTVNSVNLPNGSAITTASGTACNLALNGLSKYGPQIDTLAPNAPKISNDSVLVNVATLIGSAEANSTVTVFDGSTQLGTATADNNGAWAYKTGVLANGVNSFTATATDQAGNVGARSVAFNQEINYTPAKALSVAVSGTGISGGKGDLGIGKVVTFTLSMSGSAFVTGVPTLALNDGAVATYVSGSGTSALTFSYTIAAGQNTSSLAVTGVNLPNGAAIKDGSGTAATLTGAVATFAGLQIDGVAPNAPVISNATVGAKNATTLTGSAEANSTVTIYDGSTKLGTVATGSSGAWTFTTGALATGLHAFMATAMDQAGNIGATSSGAVDVAVGSATLAGKAGSANILIGTGGSDNFYVYNTADKVSQVAGGYGIIVSSANYTLPTHVDMLEIYGNATLGTGNSDSINYLYDFSSVASTLKAGSGADSLCVYGTAGTTLTGGAGKDTFIFANKLMGQDTVTNFSAKKDVLQFNSSLFANFAAAMADAKQVGANTVFTIDGHDSVTLQNVAKTGLAASNFHFV